MMEERFIIFSLNAEEFGLAITTVREIVQPQKIAKLPQSSPLIKGVISLRKEIIPIIDLQKRFFGIPTENSTTTRIIILGFVDYSVGILVDQVTEVLSLSPAQITTLPPFVQLQVENCGLWGIGRLEGRLLMLLDLRQVFSSTEENLLREAGN